MNMYYIWSLCVVGAPILVETLYNHTCLIIYTLLMCLTIIIIFVWLYDVPTKIGTLPKEVKNGNITCSDVQYLFI